MKIAETLRRTDIASYLLFMWNLEDVVRVFGLDIDRIDAEYISKFPQDERAEAHEWIDNIVKMMQLENVRELGHLQINKNVLIRLNDLHRELLKSPKFPEYGAEFYKTLPYIVELRAKAGDKPADEIETCFNALYGTMLLRMQGKEVSDGTEQAVKQISAFVTMLSKLFIANEQKPIFDDDDAPDVAAGASL
ncbi:MAG: DUF4924 family protein [Bacteroidales bacterium]|nr:DUF4924 family protein [Bacteroidales bacterium]